MFNFFVPTQNRVGNVFSITDGDYNHIKNVLRMVKGEQFLVSCNGQSHLCALQEYTADAVLAEILQENFQDTELPLEIHLFQGLPKSDKLEWILQKTVELGVHAVIPVETKRSIVKIEPKKKEQKQNRWQTIAESAAKQSKRSVVPTVHPATSFDKALALAKELDVIFVPYENKEGMAATKRALQTLKAGMKVGIFIGPEGGFEDNEIKALETLGAHIISLGKRILRTETAAITAVGMVMLYTETEGSDEHPAN